MLKCHLCGQELKDDEGKWTTVEFTCQACYDRPRHRYYYLNRPPGLWCQKDGFIDREVWWPARVIPDTEWYALGWVDYPFQLSCEDIWKWELRPADEIELEAYREWREVERR